MADHRDDLNSLPSFIPADHRKMIVSNTSIQQRCDGFFVRLEDLVSESLPVLKVESGAHVILAADFSEPLDVTQGPEITTYVCGTIATHCERRLIEQSDPLPRFEGPFASTDCPYNVTGRHEYAGLAIDLGMYWVAEITDFDDHAEELGHWWTKLCSQWADRSWS